MPAKNRIILCAVPVLAIWMLSWFPGTSVAQVEAAPDLPRAEAAEDWKKRYEDLRLILPDKYVELQYTSLATRLAESERQREQDRERFAAHEAKLHEDLVHARTRVSLLEEQGRRREDLIREVTALVFPVGGTPKTDPVTLQQALSILLELRPVAAFPQTDTPALAPGPEVPGQPSGPEPAVSLPPPPPPQYRAFLCFPPQAELYEEIRVTLRIIPLGEASGDLEQCRESLNFATWEERAPLFIGNDGVQVRFIGAQDLEWSWSAKPLKLSQAELHFIIPGTGKGNLIYPIQVVPGNPLYRAFRWLTVDGTAIWVAILSLIMVIITNVSKIIDLAMKAKSFFSSLWSKPVSAG